VANVICSPGKRLPGFGDTIATLLRRTDAVRSEHEVSGSTLDDRGRQVPRPRPEATVPTAYWRRPTGLDPGWADIERESHEHNRNSN
jgi:hypothetical protein